jgi:hypothetical protein
MASSPAPSPTDLEPLRTTGDGEHDVFAHYTDRADAMRSMVEGTPVTALCGKTWVPSRDPERYPVCPTCREIHATLFGS